MLIFIISWLIIGYICSVVYLFETTHNLDYYEEIVDIGFTSLVFSVGGYLLLPILVCYYIYRDKE